MAVSGDDEQLMFPGTWRADPVQCRNCGTTAELNLPRVLDWRDRPAMVALLANYPQFRCGGCGVANRTPGTVALVRPGDPINIVVAGGSQDFGLVAASRAGDEPADWGRVAGRMRASVADTRAPQMPALTVQMAPEVLVQVGWRYSGFAVLGIPDPSGDWPADEAVRVWLDWVRSAVRWPRPRTALNTYITTGQESAALETIRNFPELLVDVWVPVIRHLGDRLVAAQASQYGSELVRGRLSFLDRQRMGSPLPGEGYALSDATIPRPSAPDFARIKALMSEVTAGQHASGPALSGAVKAGEELIELCQDTLGTRHALTLTAMNDTAALLIGVEGGTPRARELLDRVVGIAIDDSEPVLADALCNLAITQSAAGEVAGADQVAASLGLLRDAAHVHGLAFPDRPDEAFALLTNAAAATRTQLVGDPCANAEQALRMYDTARGIACAHRGMSAPDELLLETNYLNGLCTLVASGRREVAALYAQLGVVCRLVEAVEVGSPARIHSLLQSASGIAELLRGDQVPDEHWLRSAAEWIAECYRYTREYEPGHSGRIQAETLLVDALVDERLAGWLDPALVQTLGPDPAEAVLLESVGSLPERTSRLHHTQWSNLGRFYAGRGQFADAVLAYQRACQYADELIEQAATPATQLAHSVASGDIYQTLAFLLAHREQVREAIHVAELARRIWPDLRPESREVEAALWARLRTGNAVLYTGTCALGLYAVLITPVGSAAWAHTIDTQSLAATIAALRVAQSRCEVDAALTDAASLLDKGLLANVARVLKSVGAAELDIVSAGLLASLPLAALPSSEGAWVDLAQPRQLTSVRTAASEPELVRSGAGVIVANPTGDLVFSQSEVAAARRWDPAITPPPQGAALRSWLLSVLPDARHLHLSCHAGYDSADPFNSRFEFGSGLAISVADIGATVTDLELVVAPCCQSAVTGTRPGDMLVGLAPALVAAGAKSVVAALWDVHDLGTAVLIARFYEELRHDGKAGPALRRAQRYLREATASQLLAGIDRGDGRGWIPSELDLELRARCIDPRYRSGKVAPFASPSQWASLIYIGR